VNPGGTGDRSMIKSLRAFIIVIEAPFERQRGSGDHRGTERGSVSEQDQA